MKKNTQDERIEKIEAALDLTVIGAIGDSVRGVIQSHETAIRNEVCSAALASVKTHIDALPEYAATFVWEAMQKACEKSYHAGKSLERSTRYGHPPGEGSLQVVNIQDIF